MVRTDVFKGSLYVVCSEASHSFGLLLDWGVTMATRGLVMKNHGNLQAALLSCSQSYI